ncbi:hypothetical protein IFM89_011629 [Coptis chinensis]|uniref:Uncharacterized protein n=1 Tax=Coptis chinensis TaxID=261450 RepID=A0A835IVX0_9MAGN|nr:hypothetical protein IFM89_011629 [Coptis chinensis]
MEHPVVGNMEEINTEEEGLGIWNFVDAYMGHGIEIGDNEPPFVPEPDLGKRVSLNMMCPWLWLTNNFGGSFPLNSGSQKQLSKRDHKESLKQGSRYCRLSGWILEGLDVERWLKEERKDHVVYWKRGKRIERTEEVTIWKKGERAKVNKKICKNRSLSGTVKKGSEPLLKDWVNENMKNLTIEEKKQKGDKDREKLTPKVLRKKKTTAMAEKALARYTNDPNYQFLHDQISALFAELLSSDIKCLKSEKYGKVSLAAKWCPFLDSSYDQSTLICESIAKKVFPRDSDPEYEGIVESHYAFKVRNRLRKQVLVPLRQALELPEIYMAANKWNSLPYKRVASVAMKIYKGLFMEHDESRFTEYLEDEECTHMLVDESMPVKEDLLDAIVAQKPVVLKSWLKVIAEKKIRTEIPGCDIYVPTLTLEGLPVKIVDPKLWESCVAGYTFVLGSLELLHPSFGCALMGYNIKTQNAWETDYEAIIRKFSEQGYGSVVPDIVFWNLRDSRSTPVAATQKGAALVSGYSKNLLTLFLGDDGQLNPELIMESAISGEEYKKLAVFD